MLESSKGIESEPKVAMVPLFTRLTLPELPPPPPLAPKLRAPLPVVARPPPPPTDWANTPSELLP